MKLTAALVTASVILNLLASIDALPSRGLLLKHGPLYESVKLLIEDESFLASELWNETLHQVNDYVYLLQDAVDIIDSYQTDVKERLERIFSTEQTPQFQQCFKQYERKVAHFNRELISKYSVCKNSLDSITDYFESEITQEVDFMAQAAQNIELLANICKISTLKQQSGNQAGVVLCVVTRIGAINQRMDVLSELCMDIMLELAAGAEYENDVVESESCRSYKALKMEFDQVYNEILDCEQQA